MFQAAITKLENVQRHFTSKITGMEGKDYWDRIKDLGLYSQERRRERYQMISIWEISQGLVQGNKLTMPISRMMEDEVG